MFIFPLVLFIIGWFFFGISFVMTCMYFNKIVKDMEELQSIFEKGLKDA